MHVEFLGPEKYTDAGRYWGGERERAVSLAELARHIESRAAPQLAAGERLEVTVTQLDRAGAQEPWHGRTGDARIVRNVYPARIDLRFRLTAPDGSVRTQGERQLRDPSFAAGAAAYGNDPLRYEKALLDSWLARELAGTRPAR